MGCGDRPRALHQPVIQVIIIGKRGGHIEHIVADVVCCHHRGVTHRAINTCTGWRPTLTGDFGILRSCRRGHIACTAVYGKAFLLADLR